MEANTQAGFSAGWSAKPEKTVPIATSILAIRQALNVSHSFLERSERRRFGYKFLLLKRRKICPFLTRFDEREEKRKEKTDIQDKRHYIRAMSKASSVPVEPQEQTNLLEESILAPGVIGGTVPGGKSSLSLQPIGPLFPPSLISSFLRISSHTTSLLSPVH
jgi:hypothetical protein